MFRRISPCDAPCCLRPKSEGSAFGFQYFRGHTGSLALRPGDSLTTLVDGFVNRLQESQFPSFLLFKLRGLNFYPGGTLTHCSCQPSLDAHFSVLIPWGDCRSTRRDPTSTSPFLANLRAADDSLGIGVYPFLPCAVFLPAHCRVLWRVTGSELRESLRGSLGAREVVEGVT